MSLRAFNILIDYSLSSYLRNNHLIFDIFEIFRIDLN